MKIRCERDTLVEALTVAGRAISNRANIPTLSGLLLRTEGNFLHMIGTDLDLTFHVSVEVTVLTEGRCVIPGRLSTDIVRALPAGAVVLEADGEEARISGGRSQFSVHTHHVDEYPRVTSNERFTATLESAVLARALHQVVRAASSDDARPVLTGVLLSAQPSGLRLVATDSYRLAVSNIDGVQILGPEGSVLVPSRALSELARLLSTSQDLQVALDDREITFAIGDIRMTSRLIEGNFPPYESLFPDAYPSRLIIDRDTLLEAVRRVKLLVKDVNTPVRLALAADGLQVSVVSQEIGQAIEDVEAKFEGEAMTVAFNPTYLIDGLEAVPAGDVTVEMIDSLKPAVVKPGEAEDFQYLIMPVRVS